MFWVKFPVKIGVVSKVLLKMLRSQVLRYQLSIDEAHGDVFKSLVLFTKLSKIQEIITVLLIFYHTVLDLKRGEGESKPSC